MATTNTNTKDPKQTIDEMFNYNKSLVTTPEAQTKVLNDQSEAAYRKQQVGVAEAQNQYVQNQAQTQLSALDAIRRSNASAIANGANAGLQAANELSAILGLQDTVSAEATDLANTAIDNAAAYNEQLNANAAAGLKEANSMNATLSSNNAELAKSAAAIYDSDASAKATVDAANIAATGQKEAADITAKANNEKVTTENKLAYLDGFNNTVDDLFEDNPDLATKVKAAVIMDYLSTDPNKSAVAQHIMQLIADGALSDPTKLSGYDHAILAAKGLVEPRPGTGTGTSTGTGTGTSTTGTFYKPPTEWSIEGLGSGRTHDNITLKIGDKSFSLHAGEAVDEKTSKELNKFISGKENLEPSTYGGWDPGTFFGAEANSEKTPERLVVKDGNMYLYTINGWRKVSDKTNKVSEAIDVWNGVKVDNLSTVEDTCLLPGTLITMANGFAKPIEQVVEGDLVMTWCSHTGTLKTAKILIAEQNKSKKCLVTTLNFSDNTNISLVTEHGFFDTTLRKYVYIHDAKDAKKYIGHKFLKMVNGKSKRVKLKKAHDEVMNTPSYSPCASRELCVYANGLLSMPGATEAFVNIFKYNKNATYKKYNKTKLIKKYGLFKAEDLKEFVSSEIFHTFQGEYLKVKIAKNELSLQDLQDLMKKYSKYLIKE
jgi:hypothetical protein